jgi:signal transduction histidine kinase
MLTSRPGLARKHSSFDADAWLRGGLLFTLAAAYALVLFTLLVAVAVLPFGDPPEVLEPPAWLLPIAGINPLLDAFLTIVLGPSMGIILVAGLVVALTMPTVVRWLRSRVDELVYGQHDDAFALVAQLHPHLDAMAPAAAMTVSDTILATIAATIAQALRLPYVEIEARNGVPSATPAATYGAPPPHAGLERIPLLYQGTKIGELRVAARRPHESLSQSDLHVLADLARQVGIALYAAQLTGDLRRSRVRLVSAREEERRRIRRDLHDGLGPTLATFAMQLEQAREQLPPDAAQSAAILGQLTTQAQTIIADIRALVYELRPPELDEFGLVSALREYLYRMQPRSATLTLDAPDVLPALPAAVEVATYRIVQEAVNNALKHAQAGAIVVALRVEEPADRPLSLRVEVRDNGIGLPPDHRVGIGLHSMRERAEELGGSWAIGNLDTDAAAGAGACVVAYLPLEDFAS